MGALLGVELKRRWVLLRRYPLNTAASLVTVTLVFGALMAGARYLAGPHAQFGARLDALIVAYWLWALIAFGMSSVAQELEAEAVTGTLEQVCMSSYELLHVVTTRAIAALVINFGFATALLAAALAIAGRPLHYPPTLVLPLAALVVTAIGIGLGLGALALRFKQVHQVLNLARFGMFLLVAIPVETWTGAPRVLGYALPLVPGAHVLRDLMARARPLDPAYFAMASASAVIYFLLGAWVFRVVDRRARRAGVLGQH